MAFEEAEVCDKTVETRWAVRDELLGEIMHFTTTDDGLEISDEDDIKVVISPSHYLTLVALKDEIMEALEARND